MFVLSDSMQAMRKEKIPIFIKYYHALAVVLLVENALFIAVLVFPKLIPWKNNSLLN